MNTTVSDGIKISQQDGVVSIYIGPDEDGNDVNLQTTAEGAINIATRLIGVAGDASRAR